MSGEDDEDEKVLQLTQREHVLQRPDTYIGAVKVLETLTWIPSKENIYNDENDDGDDDDMMEGEDKEKEKDDKDKDEIKRYASIIQNTTQIVPGLIKIYDEAITNASDHHQRHPKTCTTIRVTVNQKTGMITVWNNGPGISSDVNDSGKRGPSLIFGEFMTGTNFDDTKERTWGGRNGLGVKLTNAWSSYFHIVTVRKGKKFTQTWKNNMLIVEPFVLEAVTGQQAEEFTEVSFIPDYKRFGIKQLSNDALDVMKKRVLDMAGVFSSLKVYWNGERVRIQSFGDYCNMYMSNSLARTRFEFTDKKAIWQVVVAFNPQEVLTAISFVNGITTEEGGTHVDHVLDVLIPHLQDAVKASSNEKDLKVTPAMIRSCLTVFVAALIPNPAFHTQTKTKLVTPKHEFKEPFSLPTAAIKRLKSSSAGSLVSRIVEVVERKHGTQLAKTDKKFTRNTKIPKLEDAEQAGKAEWAKCMLILTEGDSAKALAMSGLSVVGKRYYGVYPLRGKPLNVRECGIKTLAKNKEFEHMKTIMGLQNRLDSGGKLRYGKILIATDADSDGMHIAALIANMIHRFWPERLKEPGFLNLFRTPVTKIWPKNKKNTKKNGSLWFYSLPQFNKWESEHAEEMHRLYEHKHYKGLGTSSPAEAKEYFENLSEHIVPLQYGGTKEEDKQFEMLFSKYAANLRKKWIQDGTTRMNEIASVYRTEMTTSQFMNEQYILHGIENCERMLPSLVDGFKTVQRKVMAQLLFRNVVKPMKVVAVTGAVMNKMAYHHGDASLSKAITGMAQNFVGSNNINLLVPDGQFGTRAAGGHDAAQSRYIHTYLTSLARHIFRKEDDTILKRLTDDGKPVEPVFFLPIIPMLLVNGCSAIATGWASDIPSHNIRLLISMLKTKLSSPPSVSNALLSIKTEPLDSVTIETKETSTPILKTLQTPTEIALPTPTGIANGTPTHQKAAKISPHSLPRVQLPSTKLQPYYRGFLGTVEYEPESGRFWACGKYRIDDIGSGQKCITVEEIPIHLHFNQYDKMLQKLKDKEAITDFEKKILSYDDHLHFEIFVTTEQFAKLQAKYLAPLKLASRISVNAVAFDERGRITAYKNVQDLFDAYFDVRLPFYETRKAAILQEYNNEYKLLMNKARFIEMIISGKMDVSVKEELVYDVLDELKFDQIIAKKKLTEKEDGDHDGEEGERETKTTNVKKEMTTNQRKRGYQYLMKLTMIQQTEEQYEKLQAKCREIAQEIDRLQKKTIQQMWIDELNELLVELDRVDAIEQKEKESEQKQHKNKIGKRGSPFAVPQSPMKMAKQSPVNKTARTKKATVKLEPVTKKSSAVAANKPQKRKAGDVDVSPAKRQKRK